MPVRILHGVPTALLGALSNVGTLSDVGAQVVQASGARAHDAGAPAQRDRRSFD